MPNTILSFRALTRELDEATEAMNAALVAGDYDEARAQRAIVLRLQAERIRRSGKATPPSK